MGNRWNFDFECCSIPALVGERRWQVNNHPGRKTVRRPRRRRSLRRQPLSFTRQSSGGLSREFSAPTRALLGATISDVCGSETAGGLFYAGIKNFTAARIDLIGLLTMDPHSPQRTQLFLGYLSGRTRRRERGCSACMAVSTKIRTPIIHYRNVWFPDFGYHFSRVFSPKVHLTWDQ
jgi:hypothetical protein